MFGRRPGSVSTALDVIRVVGYLFYEQTFDYVSWVILSRIIRQGNVNFDRLLVDFPHAVWTVL